MTKIKKTTTKIVLRKDKVLSTGKHPIMLRVTFFNRKPKYYVLKGDYGTLSTELHRWNKEIGRINRDKKLNQFLDQYEMRAKEVLRELEFSEFTFTTFEDYYFKKCETESITSFIDHLIEKLKNESRLRSASSCKHHQN